MKHPKYFYAICLLGAFASIIYIASMILHLRYELIFIGACFLAFLIPICLEIRDTLRDKNKKKGE